MSRISAEELKSKKDKFIDEYLKDGNGAKAARAAGWSKSRATQTASELLKDDYVVSKIKKYQQMGKETSTDSDLSFDETLDLNRAVALQQLANKAKSGDEKAAKTFLDIDYKYKKLNQEVLGEYEGYSTTEILRAVDSLIEEITELKKRTLETLGEEEV